jgi:Ni2+-binding GTPase involved in maturation of urease and hydrogenase
MASLNPGITIIKTSATRGEGIDEWLDWIDLQLKNFNIS